MRVLHTSDWHLGHSLRGEVTREHEHAAFLAWLLEACVREAADALVITGDVFDSATPPASAERMWFEFLAAARRACPAMDIVAIAGNHDSPARLGAASAVLRELGVHVIGGLPRTADGAIDLDRVLIPIAGGRGLVAAVPFLRPIDLPPELEDPLEAIYAEVIAGARARLAPEQALIVTGHLYVAGADAAYLSERRVSIGGVESAPLRLFPRDIAYVALGHIHRAQRIGRDTIRYAGAPIALALDEAGYKHQVNAITFTEGRVADMRPLLVPQVIEILRIPRRGAAPLGEVLAALDALPARIADDPARPYLEVVVALDQPQPKLRVLVETALDGKHARLVQLHVEHTGHGAALGDRVSARRLAELDPRDVFVRLWAREHAEPPAPEVLAAFDRLLAEVSGDAAESGGIVKILAIRGCNLASLAGEFEIDLANGALGAAGVFAIVGNTGAGKSTLLDALCVALFDRTPRLTNHSRVLIGRGEEDPGALGAQDVRTLLRRGASHGWAEVDFESGDARRYRARWSVRRARGQVDGTLQAQQVTLTTLDGGERLGGTKTETLEAIHLRLGLTFDQFRRSALLAQGEFAAFLRADGKDRSELLERMTGTSIYTRLSVQAHLRAALAEQRLATGRTAALAIPVLDDAARPVAEADRTLAEAARTAARDRHAAAEAAARWAAEHAARTDALAAAEAAHAEAVRAEAGGEAERAELALRRRAEALRGVWEEAERRDRELAAIHAEVVAAEAAVERATVASAAIGARRGELTELHAPVRAARIAAQLVERTAGSGDVSTALEDAAWLTARAALAPEIAAWTELDARFAQHAAAHDAIVALDRARDDQTKARDKLARARGDRVTEHQATIAKHGEAQRKADAFQKRRGLSLDAARRNEDEARTRLADVERLVAIGVEARRAQASRDDIDRRLAELSSEAAADGAERVTVEAARTTSRAIRGEREHALAELRKAAGYDHARAELVAGDPCPLCGAAEHPWAGRGAFHDAVVAASGRLVEVVSQLDAATMTVAALDARGAHRTREQASLAPAREVATAGAASAAARWTDQLAALGELSLLRDPLAAGAEAYAQELHAIARKKLEEARAMRSQTEAATKAAADAQSDVQLCQANVDAAAGRLAEIDRKLAELDAAIRGITGERASRVERHAELAAELDAAVVRWSAAAGTPAPKRTTPRVWLGELAVAWRARTERVAHAEAVLAAALAALDVEARAAEAAAAEQGGRRTDALRRREAANAALASAAAALEEARGEAGFDADELRRLLAASPARLDELAASLAQVERSVVLSRALATERADRLAEHAAARPPSLEDAGAVAELAAALHLAEQHAARAAAVLAADDDARVRRARALELLQAAESDADIDRVLGAVIGSHDGKKFRSFAQSLTLDGLLGVANAHLEELAPRYQLERVPNHDLELQVIDRDLGEEVRSVQSLSGGESFLVSLALALGLSSMSAHDVKVRTLLIDEGFGTLDPATLDSALGVLDALQSRGRQVGVISHVPQLVERVGAHVRVVQRGGGRSEVIVA